MTLLFLLPHFSTSLYECSFLCVAMSKTRISFFFRMIRRPNETLDHISHEYTATVRTVAAVVCSKYPDRTGTKKEVTPLESSHRHRRPARAASASAARGRCFDPKRAATASGCRARLVSRERRVGSIVRQDQTQAHINSSTSIYELPVRARPQPPHRPSPMPQ